MQKVRLPLGIIIILLRIGQGVVYMNEPALQVGGFGIGTNQLGGVDTVEIDRWGKIYAVDDVQRLIKVWNSWTHNGNVSRIISTTDIENAGLGTLGKIEAIAAVQSWIPHRPRSFYIIDSDKDRDPEI